MNTASRLVLLPLLAIAGSVLLSGCAGGDPEDEAFFNRGWINPKERDSFGATPKIKPKTPEYYQPQTDYR